VGQAALGWFGGASSAFAMIYELLAPPSPLSRTAGQNPTKVRLPCVQRVHRWWSRNSGGAHGGAGAPAEQDSRQRPKCKSWYEAKCVGVGKANRIPLDDVGNVVEVVLRMLAASILMHWEL